MSNLSINLKNENNFPKITVLIKKDSSVKESIVASQISNKLENVFSSQISNNAEDALNLDGILLKRKISHGGKDFYSNIINVFQSDSKDLEFVYSEVDSKKYDIPSINDVTKNECNISYEVIHFQVPYNILTASEIKIEEHIIYKNYKKNKNIISSARAKILSKDIKNNIDFKEIDPIFFDLFSVSKKFSNSIKLNIKNRQSINDKILTKIVYNKDNVYYQISYNNVSNYNFHLKKVQLYSQENNAKKVIAEKSFNINEVEYDVIDNNVFFSILKSSSYDKIVNDYDNVKLQIVANIYNSLNDNILTSKTDTFNL